MYSQIPRKFVLISNQSQTNRLVSGNTLWCFYFLSYRGNEEIVEESHKYPGSYFKSPENYSLSKTFCHFFYIISPTVGYTYALPLKFGCARTRSVAFHDQVSLLTGRCCSKSSGEAEASGTHNHEEPAYPWQGYSQPLQSFTRIQVRDTDRNIQLWHFIELQNASSFSGFNKRNTVLSNGNLEIEAVSSYLVISEAAYLVLFCNLGSWFLTCPRSLSLHPVTSIKAPCAGQVRHLWLFVAGMGVPTQG